MLTILRGVPDGSRGCAKTGAAPLRVLWLIKGLGPGGAERLLVVSARLRDRARVTGRVAYLLPWKNALVDELHDVGIETTCLGARNSWDIRWLRRLRRALSRAPVDVVHVHSPLAAVGTRLVVRTLPRDRRPRVVTTEHNVWDSHARLTSRMNALTAPLDDARIAVSSGVRDSMPTRLRATTEVIVHGVDIHELQPARASREAMRDAFGFGDDVVVCTVANLRATKAYPDLLRAAQQVLAARDDVRFVAVGQGPLEGELRALHAELGLGARFQLLGYRDDAANVMAASDVFCLSSRYEGLPVALMEALALGLPVVATRVGGIEELVTSGCEAVLVPPSRPDLLADALLDVAADPELRTKMARHAVERAATLDAEGAVRRTEAVYREVLAR
jgi:glycosyltransferase involved in cell wall biosynthesis